MKACALWRERIISLTTNSEGLDCRHAAVMVYSSMNYLVSLSEAAAFCYAYSTFSSAVAFIARNKGTQVTLVQRC